MLFFPLSSHPNCLKVVLLSWMMGVDVGGTNKFVDIFDFDELIDVDDEPVVRSRKIR